MRIPATGIILNLLAFSLPFTFRIVAGAEILPFEPEDTLEEIHYKIDHNGYSFTVDHNWVFDMSSEEKSRFFSRHAPVFPRALTAGTDIGPLGGRLGTLDLPEEFDWRNYNGHAYIGDIRDQGGCGSCYAFGANAAAEGTYNWANGLYDDNCIDFSESYIIWCLGRLPAYNGHFFGCDGADYDYMELEALTVEGVAEEADFPYTTSDPGSCTHWSDQTTVFQGWYRVECSDIEATKTAIMTYGVVDAAVFVESAFNGYSGGIYQDSNTDCDGIPCSYTTTNHAIALVGWDDSPPEGGGGVWILRNSWGDSWGESGYMRIRYTSAAVSCAVCYLVYQPPPSPTPTPIGYCTPTPTPSITPTPEGYLTPTPSATPSITPSPAPQSIPFSEDFEGAWADGAPEGWLKEYIMGSNDWTQSNGGGYGHPTSAHSGSGNALFFYENIYYLDTVTRLISPHLEFGLNIHNARLTFWLYMEEWELDQDELSVYYRTSLDEDWNLLTHYDTSIPSWTEQVIDLPEPGDDYYICFQGTSNYGYGVCVDDLLITGDAFSPTPSPVATPPATATPTVTPFAPPQATSTPTPTATGHLMTPSPISSPSPPLAPIRRSHWIHDFNGDGSSDIAIFREESGLWAVRGITRIYFGTGGDIPVPGDYDGDGTTDLGVFRENSGLWALRGLSRIYFGGGYDTPLPGDYNGDGTWEAAVFRENPGLWAIRSISRTYFGRFGDTPVPGYYSGENYQEIGIFRKNSGLWAVRGITRVYFGGSADTAKPGDYNSDEAWEPAIFRAGSGLWAVRGVTRIYFGSSVDEPIPADYNGDNSDDPGIFRSSSGLWAARGITRVYFGGVGDIPVTR